MEVRCCIYCGRDTQDRSQICAKCLGAYSHKSKDSASALPPTTLLESEFEHDYSEDALAPHSSDQRWSWDFV